MKIYLASRYSRMAEMRTYRAQLERLGYVVTSRWVDGQHEADNRETHSVQLAGFAQEDRDDVAAADCVISFTEAPRGGHSRGGRHVEHGMALAWNKRVIVVGYRENVFHSLPEVEFFETWREAYFHLTMTPERRRAQRKSWVVGETMLAHPEMTREEAERIYDEVDS